jgi:hypothetical protein
VARLAILAIAIWLLSGAAQAAPAATTDANENGDAAQAEIDRKLEDAAKLRQLREQDIIHMVDALRADLQQLLQDAKTIDEQRAQSLRQQIDALQVQLSKDLAANASLDATRADALQKSIDDIKKQPPSVLPWISMIVSILTAAGGAWVSSRIALTNRTHSDSQRTADNDRSDRLRKDDIDRADELRKEDLDRIAKQVSDEQERTRNQIKQSTAYDLFGQWQLLHEDISRARGYFQHIDRLTEEGYSLVAKVGNWYEGLALHWVEETADRTILTTRSLIEQAKIFRTEVEQAHADLTSGKGPAIRSNFRDELDQWITLAKL